MEEILYSEVLSLEEPTKEAQFMWALPGIYSGIFSNLMNDNMMSYGQYLTPTRLDMAHFDLAGYIGQDFLHSMMMVTIKQVYGYVIWFALALAAIFLLCDIPAVRTNIRKVPRWPVYAIEYLAKKN